MHHPSTDELRHFSSGQLEADHIERLAAHLHDCQDCIDHLDALSEVDPLVAQLRRCGPLPEDLEMALRKRRIGNYQMLEELGRGGMGIVHRAFDERLKRDVALKLIPTGIYADLEQRRRLRQEAETIAVLRHPGIVQIYDVGEEAGVMYIALELLSPAELTVLGRQHGPRWCAAVIRQVAQTLYHAHQAGFVHRDMKPDNILLAPSQDTHPKWTPDGVDDERLPRLKITDFGLSKPLDDHSHMTQAGMLLGTPDYMAPEQIPDSQQPVGPAADIHALGAILYELLSGQPPFRSQSISEQIERLRHDEPETLRTKQPHVPQDLATICCKCLRKLPRERYASAQDLAADLERFLHNEPIHARAPKPWEKLINGARRAPILAAHATAASLLRQSALYAASVRHVGAARADPLRT